MRYRDKYENKAGNQMARPELLLDILHLLPLSLEVLLPQANLVIASAHSKDVPAGAPAHPPQNAVELELLASPLAGVGRIRGPDANGFILRGRGDVRLGQDARGPSNVAHPVGVALQRLNRVVGLGFGAIIIELAHCFLDILQQKNTKHTCNPKSSTGYRFHR